MLVMASAADAKVGALGRDAFGGDGDNLRGFGGGVAATVLDDADAGLFARKG
jgi:hypothetical protein